MLLLASAAFGRVPLGERIHYAFGHRECAAGAFTQSAAYPESGSLFLWDDAPSAHVQRLLRPDGLGSSCLGGRNGVQLNASCCCAPGSSGCPASMEQYAPLYTSEVQDAELGYGMSDGLTIELWLRPTERPTRRVMVSLGVAAPTAPLACPTSTSGPAAQTFSEEGGFVLFQNEAGCLQLDVALSSDTACMRLPEFPNYCQVLGFPQLDDSALHHVVVTLAHNLREAPGSGDPTRFAIYLDGVRVIDSDAPPNIGSADDINYTADLGSLSSRAVLNTLGTTEYEPAVLWDPAHVLRIGTDGFIADSFSGGPSPWEGELAMFALYGRPLSEAEVNLNFAAGIDNSAPLAVNANVSVLEDACSLLPDFEPLASDADNEPPLSRAQTLTFSLNASSLERGGLFSDSECLLPLPAGVQPYAPPIYFRAAPDEFSIGDETYASLLWTVRNPT